MTAKVEEQVAAAPQQQPSTPKKVADSAELPQGTPQKANRKTLERQGSILGDAPSGYKVTVQKMEQVSKKNSGSPTKEQQKNSSGVSQGASEKKKRSRGGRNKSGKPGAEKKTLAKLVSSESLQEMEQKLSRSNNSSRRNSVVSQKNMSNLNQNPMDNSERKTSIAMDEAFKAPEKSDVFSKPPELMIGVFCGVFDPIHENHAAIIDHAARFCHKVFVVVLPDDVSGQGSCHKVRKCMVDNRVRTLPHKNVQVWNNCKDEVAIGNRNYQKRANYVRIIKKYHEKQQAQSPSPKEVTMVHLMGQNYWERLTSAQKDFKTRDYIKVYPMHGYESKTILKQTLEPVIDGKVRVASQHSDVHKTSSSKLRDYFLKDKPLKSKQVHDSVVKVIESVQIYKHNESVAWPLVLISGGPASGKTTLGKAVALKLGYEFISGDEIMAEVKNCDDDPELKQIASEIDDRYDNGFRSFAAWLLKQKLRPLCPTSRDTSKFKGVIIEGAGFGAKTLEMIEDKFRKIACVIQLRCPSIELCGRLDKNASAYSAEQLRWKKNMGARTKELKIHEELVSKWAQKSEQNIMFKIASKDTPEEECIEIAAEHVTSVYKAMVKKSQEKATADLMKSQKLAHDARTEAFAILQRQYQRDLEQSLLAAQHQHRVMTITAMHKRASLVHQASRASLVHQASRASLVHQAAQAQQALMAMSPGTGKAIGKGLKRAASFGLIPDPGNVTPKASVVKPPPGLGAPSPPSKPVLVKKNSINLMGSILPAVDDKEKFVALTEKQKADQLKQIIEKRPEASKSAEFLLDLCKQVVLDSAVDSVLKENENISTKNNNIETFSVFDYCCGEGEDAPRLHESLKNSSAKLAYFGVDMSESKIKTAKHAFEEFVVPSGKVRDAGFFVSNCAKEGIIDEILTAGTNNSPLSFHLVNCMHSIEHIFSCNKDTKQFLQNASQQLCEGGIFLCTTINVDQLKRASFDCNERVSLVHQQGASYEIKFDDARHVRKIYKCCSDEGKGFGPTFQFQIGDQSSEKVFVVPHNTLLEFCAREGLQFVQKKNWSDEIKSEQYNDLKKSCEELPPNFASYEKDIASLFTTYTFKKTGPVSVNRKSPHGVVPVVSSSVFNIADAKKDSLTVPQNSKQDDELSFVSADDKSVVSEFCDAEDSGSEGEDDVVTKESSSEKIGNNNNNNINIIKSAEEVSASFCDDKKKQSVVRDIKFVRSSTTQSFSLSSTAAEFTPGVEFSLSSSTPKKPSRPGAIPMFGTLNQPPPPPPKPSSNIILNSNAVETPTVSGKGKGGKPTGAFSRSSTVTFGDTSNLGTTTVSGGKSSAKGANSAATINNQAPAKGFSELALNAAPFYPASAQTPEEVAIAYQTAYMQQMMFPSPAGVLLPSQQFGMNQFVGRAAPQPPARNKGRKGAGKA